MALGNPLLPDPQDSVTCQNGAGIRCTFDGSEQGRLRWDVPISAGLHTFRLTVHEIPQPDYFQLQVGGTYAQIDDSDEVGVHEGTVDSEGTSNTIRLTGDGIKAEVSLQVWPGTED
jgi:hypothetical protein